MSAKTKTMDQQEKRSSSNNAQGPTTTNDDGANDDLVNLLSQLQLPRMNPGEPPSLRILAVADIDLASAAALAEYALHESDLGGGNVDLCIACGPFCTDQDLPSRYLQGRSKIRHGQKSPHTKSREETAALEALMSGALSQLESIVCRVVYLPHLPTDPCTTFKTKEDHLRLTPNSVNIHQRWLQLAPGIGCSGYGERGLDETGPDYYANAVTRLLDLAPPPPPTTSQLSTLKVSQASTDDALFSLHVAQAILVTHTKTSQNNNDTNGEYWLEYEEQHSRFLDSPRAQMQLVLNIVANVNGPTPPASFAPVNEKRGNIQLVAPGSLREHGDFALIDMTLYQDSAVCETAVDPPERRRTYSWGVDRVEFRNMRRV